MIEHSGAAVLAKYLIAEGVFVVTTSTQPWRLYVGNQPDSPIKIGTIYDTEGFREGRIQRTGRSVKKPGWQIRLRGPDHNECMLKGYQAISKLEEILRTPVTIGAKQYKIQSVRSIHDPIPIGQEEGGGRLLFTINGTITYGEAS